MHGRFQFFEIFAANDGFYLKVAKPLLSIGTVGSMATARKINSILYNILTNVRNRPKDAKAVVLFRALENLWHTMKAKKILGKKITVSF